MSTGAEPLSVVPPTPERPDHVFESTESQWASGSADSASARLTIPYLGPIPAPSRLYGLALILGYLVVAMLQVVKAVLSLHQAQLDQDFVSSGGAATLATKVLDG